MSYHDERAAVRPASRRSPTSQSVSIVVRRRRRCCLLCENLRVARNCLYVRPDGSDAAHRHRAPTRTTLAAPRPLRSTDTDRHDEIRNNNTTVRKRSESGDTSCSTAPTSSERCCDEASSSPTLSTMPNASPIASTHTLSSPSVVCKMKRITYR